MESNEDVPHRKSWEAAWRQFDDLSGNVQASMLGRAIMHHDGMLRRRLLRKSGLDFEPSDEEVICLGKQFLDFVVSERTDRCRAIAAIIESMEAGLD